MIFQILNFLFKNSFKSFEGEEGVSKKSTDGYSSTRKIAP